MAVRLTKKSLLEFIEAHDPDEEVGLVGSATRCPISQFIEANGGENPATTEELYSYWGRNGYVQRSMPLWASRFVNEVDKTAGYCDPVPAQTAKNVLEGV
jgi:hypothetical protein